LIFGPAADTFAAMYAARLRESLPRVRERIARAVERSGRSEPVGIVAVTKGHPPDAVRAAVEAGLPDCGENRVAELAAKRETLGDLARWHLIGHLQRNKVRQALPLFRLLHSLDSLRLAREVSKEAERAGVEVRALVQVNASGEETKGGFEVSAGCDAITSAATLPKLRIEGLMTMAPLTDDEGVLRATFRRTRALFDQCARTVPGFEPRFLSMGMSNDFEIAVEEGANLVRLGTILFGERSE
jgi:pyridoxal phosphate enzyme (YggS family)